MLVDVLMITRSPRVGVERCIERTREEVQKLTGSTRGVPSFNPFLHPPAEQRDSDAQRAETKQHSENRCSDEL